LGYTEQKLFREAEAYPWRLAAAASEEVVRANLEALAALHEAPSTDPFTAPLWRLLRAGASRGPLTQAVLLLRHVRWSTLGVEQMHGSLSTVHRFHPELGLRALATRSALHMVRALFQQPEEARALAKKEARVQKLERQLPRRATGRHAFFRALRAQVQANLPRGKAMSRAASNELFRRHSAMWLRLTPDQQQYYHQEAAIFAASKAEELEGDRHHEASAMDLVRQRATEEAAATQGLFRLASFRMEVQDLERLVDLLNGGELRGNNLQALRENALQSPQPPSSAAKAVLMGCAIVDPLPLTGLGLRGQLPAWIRDIAAARHNVGRCLLTGPDMEEGDAGYLFLYATASPLQAYFLRLEPQRAHPHCGGLEPGRGSAGHGG
jgi:hypothetical protein